MRICGVKLRENKIFYVELTNVYGIGIKTSKLICSKFDISSTARVKDISPDLVVQITEHIENTYRVEGKLKSDITTNFLKNWGIRRYKATRVFLGLPARGQRSKTNAKNCRNASLLRSSKRILNSSNKKGSK